MSSIADPAQPLLDVRLSPHRSLSRRQARLLLCGVAVLSAGVSLPFVLLGAWPVVGFMGLDVLLLYWAFAANFRAARAYEIVCVSTLELFVAKVDQSGRQREWRLHPCGRGWRRRRMRNSACASLNLYRATPLSRSRPISGRMKSRPLRGFWRRPWHRPGADRSILDR